MIFVHPSPLQSLFGGVGWKVILKSPFYGWLLQHDVRYVFGGLCNKLAIDANWLFVFNFFFVCFCFYFLEMYTYFNQRVQKHAQIFSVNPFSGSKLTNNTLTGDDKN